METYGPLTLILFKFFVIVGILWFLSGIFSEGLNKYTYVKFYDSLDKAWLGLFATFSALSLALIVCGCFTL